MLTPSASRHSRLSISFAWKLSAIHRRTAPSIANQTTVEYILGAFIFHSDWTSIEHQLWAVPGFPPGTPIAGQLFNGPFTNNFFQKDGFGLRVRVGHLAYKRCMAPDRRAALTDERKRALFGRTNAAPFTIWNTGANPTFPTAELPFSIHSSTATRACNNSISKDLMLYVSYGHGHENW